jgi:methyl coenzyme M reductase subunit C
VEEGESAGALAGGDVGVDDGVEVEEPDEKDGVGEIDDTEVGEVMFCEASIGANTMFATPEGTDSGGVIVEVVGGATRGVTCPVG